MSIHIDSHPAIVISVVDKTVPFEDVPNWFTGIRFNFAENLLRYRDDRIAFYVADETSDNVEKVTCKDMYNRVALYTAALRKAGLKKGDVVVGYIANILPAVEFCLAAASIGAIWSAVSLEFGVGGVVERLKQVKPKMLFGIDSNISNGVKTDFLPKLQNIISEIPSIEKVIIVPFKETSLARDISVVPKSCFLDDFLKLGKNPDGSIPKLEFEQYSFNEPMFLFYTSGTTGQPKPIIQRAGGYLIAFYKDMFFHGEVTRDDVMMMFSAVGWAGWMFSVLSLYQGGASVLYNGNAFSPRNTTIWDLVDRCGVTLIMLYPWQLDKMENEGLKPRESHNLSSLKCIMSAGATLKPQNWEYILNEIRSDVYVASIVGCTDTMCGLSCINYTLPVYMEESQSFSLGLAMDCFDDFGKPILGERGELVCKVPFPSQPLGFWNDEHKTKYKKSYFSKYPGIWYQGDFCMINPVTKGLLMLGRSDNVLNPGGRRIGTSEIYAVVERFPEIEDSVCASKYFKDGDEKFILFVKLISGYSLTSELIEKITNKIKQDLTEKHAPSLILSVKDIPYNTTGKKVEAAVRQVISGEKASASSLVNPESLEYYQNIPQLMKL